MNQVIATPAAPAAIGPYSQALLVGNLLFASGQLGLDPATGVLPAAFADQAEQAFRNVEAILQAAGMSLLNVVKTTVFLADMADFAVLNDVYAAHFKAAGVTAFPARSAVAVRTLPKGALVEVEVIASKA